MAHVQQSEFSVNSNRKAVSMSSRFETVLHATLIGAAFIFVAALVCGVFPA